MRKKIALQFLVSNVAMLANFALTVILARLLSPTDIGIFSMSAVIIAVAHVFRDFGVTAFLKQEKILSNNTIRGAIGLLIATSWTVGLLMYLSAPLWATFFGEPKVLDVVHVLALGFIFIPFGAVPQALLMREMDVTKSAWVTAIATTIYFFSSIALAYGGFEHMTMAWANLIGILVSGFAYNIILKTALPWIPNFYGWKRISSFGTGNLISALLKSLDNAIPDIALGKLSTPANVGLFSRGNSTVNMIGTVIHPTIYFFAVPYLAKTHHAQGNLHREFIKGSSIINCLMMPALVWVAIVAQDIVSLLYGNQWLAASEVIPWLSAAVAASVLFILTGYAVTGIGKPHAMIAPLLFVLAAKCAFILWLFDGSLRSFAMAIALGQMAGIPVHLWINSHYLHVPQLDWLKAVAKVVPAWIVPGFFLHVVHTGLPENWPSLFRIGLSSSIYVMMILAFYLTFDLPIRYEIRQVINRFTDRNNIKQNA